MINYVYVIIYTVNFLTNNLDYKFCFNKYTLHFGEFFFKKINVLYFL